ncbi:histidine phosphatase family protein [uncultured Sphingomonas sp.]|uniref:histidine phosphatase family protein n=1 Tax=uncultured Sphingomonas sp. TaxID=158754 RepID=UPI0035CBD891
MTATIFLIRHAAHGHLGHTLSGRLPGIALSEAGLTQARTLSATLAPLRFAAIHTSPVQRAVETARAIAAGRGLSPVVVDALDEIDFGQWTGRGFAELDEEPGWSAWNQARGSARAADGETMADAQTRIVAHIEAAARLFPEQAIAIVSHCDLLRAAIAHYLSLPLDHMLRFDVDPASVSRLEVGDGGGRVLSINTVVS